MARLTALGARELWKVDEPGAFHTTMADPEGNEFCVSSSGQAHEVPSSSMSIRSAAGCFGRPGIVHMSPQMA